MREVIQNTVSKERSTAGVTQEELAAAVGVSRQTVISIERGNYAPSVLLALKIAHYFKKPLESIFTISHVR